MGHVSFHFILREEGFKEITWATGSRDLEWGSFLCCLTGKPGGHSREVRSEGQNSKGWRVYQETLEENRFI